MSAEGKLMDMLTGYAAAHQHPFNIFVHMIGIPTIMLGIMIPLTWVGFEIDGFRRWWIFPDHACGQTG